MIASAGIGKERYADRLDALDINWLLSKGCVFWYRGKTGSDFPILSAGVTATPSGTWANDLTLNNGRKIKTFNGSTNYISMPNNATLLMGASNFSIAVWVRFGIIPATGVSYVIWCGTDSQFYALQLNAGGSIHFNGYASSAYIWSINSGAGTIVVNTWAHVTCVRNGNYQAIYINGAQSGETGFGAAALGAHANPFYISECTYPYGNPNKISGNIKDLIVCKNYALSIAEIAYLYNTTKKYLRIS